MRRKAFTILCLAFLALFLAGTYLWYTRGQPADPKAQVEWGMEFLASAGQFSHSPIESQRLYAEAATGFKKAAKHGDATAECQLGFLAEKGLGRDKDYSAPRIMQRQLFFSSLRHHGLTRCPSYPHHRSHVCRHNTMD